MTSWGGKDNLDKNKYHIWDIYKAVLYKPDIVFHRAVLDRSVV